MKPLYTGCSTRCTRPSPILPAVFDDIMSYEQQIAKLCESFNELNEYVNSEIEEIKGSLQELVIKQVNALVSDLRLDFIHLSEKFDLLEDEFENLSSQFDEFKKNVEDDINSILSEFWSQVDIRITDIQKDLTAQYNSLRQYVEKLNNDTLDYTTSYTDANISALRTDVYNRLDQMQKQLDGFAFGNITVSNWFTHSRTSLQKLLDNMWDYMRGCALDAREVDLLPLTAQTIDDLELPSYQYDTQSWRRLFFNLVFVPEIKKLIDEKTSMRNPYTGELSPVSDVANRIFDSINFNGKTLAEYEALGVTAGEFGQSDFDAFTQDTDKNWRRVTTDYENKWLGFNKLVWFDANYSSHVVWGVNYNIDLSNVSRLILTCVDLRGNTTHTVIGNINTNQTTYNITCTNSPLSISSLEQLDNVNMQVNMNDNTVSFAPYNQDDNTPFRPVCVYAVLLNELV